MKGYFAVFLCVSLLLAFWSSVDGGDKKEVTIKGTIECAKCALMLEGQKKCATVIVEKKKVDGKDTDVIYWFDTESHKKYHSNICSEAKEGTVTGVVTTKDKKNTIAPTKVEFNK
jgi:Family of unknown function (DUF6370)